MLAGVGGRCWRQGTPKSKQQLTRWGAAGLWELCPAVQPLGRIRPRRRSPGNRQEETGVSWQEAPVQGWEKRSRVGVQKHLFSGSTPLGYYNVLSAHWRELGGQWHQSPRQLQELSCRNCSEIHSLVCTWVEQRRSVSNTGKAIFILRPRLVILVFVKKIQTKPFMLQSMSSLKTTFPGAKD